MVNQLSVAILDSYVKLPEGMANITARRLVLPGDLQGRSHDDMKISYMLDHISI